MQRIHFTVLAAFLVLSAVCAAQETAPEAVVRINGEELFVLQSGVGSFSLAERAEAVNRRLQSVLESPPAKIEARIEKTDLGLLILIGDRPIISVTDKDAEAEKVAADVLAARWSGAIQESLLRVGGERARVTLVRRALITALVLVVAVLALVLLRRVRGWQVRAIEARRERIPSLRFRGLELVSADVLYQVLSRVGLLVYVGALVVVSAGALLLVFEQFPATQNYARQVFLWVWNPLARIFWGVVGYLPNLFYILVVIAVTRYVIRGLGFVFEQAHRGVISLEPWLHRDVARPTSQIVKAVLIVLALFFIAPLIPGTGTTAAQAITILIGLMVSFGSTSTVGNIIAGVVLTYMRPFQLGERVRIADTVGDVVERTFLYIKILTIKNEEVIVPSLQALSNAIVNYSAKAHGSGLILHTSVTIGYDAPWRKVHELLIRAAERTNHILKEPKPFVLQTSLDDWYISYQLNAYTDQPNKMAVIYSGLHQNIQDSFNEGGVEIMSPHYHQLRDGNTTTIPQEYRDRSYQPPRFLVETRAGAAQV